VIDYLTCQPTCVTDSLRKEHLGGFAVVDVPDDAEARYWAGGIAVVVGWPQEVHRSGIAR